MDELTQLANTYRTDKGSEYFCAHNYTQHYHAAFHTIKNEPLSILEIGLNVRDRSDCPSLHMWLDYFPNATVYGLDNRKFDFHHPRAKILYGDQSNINSLTKIKHEIPEHLDIIIDDGSHIQEHQHRTFENLFHLLKRGGYYCIEDLTSSVAQGSWKLFLALKERDFIKAIASTCIEASTLETLYYGIGSIELYPSANNGYGSNSLVIIQKI